MIRPDWFLKTNDHLRADLELVRVVDQMAVDLNIPAETAEEAKQVLLITI